MLAYRNTAEASLELPYTIEWSAHPEMCCTHIPNGLRRPGPCGHLHPRRPRVVIGQSATPLTDPTARNQRGSSALLTTPRPFALDDGSSPLVSIRTRVGLAALVLSTLLLFGIGVITQIEALRGSAATIFLLTELGIAPTLLFRRINAIWFGVIAISLSLGGTISVGFVMAITHLWNPAIAMAIVVVATFGMLAAAIIRDLPQLSTPARREPGWRAPSPTALVTLTTLAGLLVVVLVTVTGRSDPQPGGLFRSVNPLWYLGLVLLVAAALLAWRLSVSPAFPVLTLSGIVVTSQAIVYGSPSVMSAARHVGIIDYIRIHHGVNTSLDIYQAWSGLFAGIAWLADVGNIADVMTVATWWPTLLSPAIALAVAALASRFVVDRFRIWCAAAVFALTSTLNILYFSPQSLGLLLAIVVIALAVSPRRNRATALPVGRARVALILFFSIVMAISHQISPYLAVAALVALLIFGYLRPWWLVLLVLAPAVLWALANTAVLGHFISLDAIGQLSSNVKPPSHTFTQLPTPAITGATFALPAVVLFLTGLVALATLLLIRKRLVWAIALAAVSPATLLVATNYGQEGIFRVVLFAGPWLALLVAGLPLNHRVLTRSTRTLRWAKFAVLSGVLAALLGVNAFGQTALDWNRVIARDAAIATQTYEALAPDGSIMLLTGTGNATPQAISGRYLDLAYLSREALGGYPAPAVDYDSNRDVASLTKTFVTSGGPAARYYALVSTSIGAYDERYGAQSFADYREFAASMAISPFWKPILGGSTTTMYQLTAAGLAFARG